MCSKIPRCLSWPTFLWKRDETNTLQEHHHLAAPDFFQGTRHMDGAMSWRCWSYCTGLPMEHCTGSPQIFSVFHWPQYEEWSTVVEEIMTKSWLVIRQSHPFPKGWADGRGRSWLCSPRWPWSIKICCWYHQWVPCENSSSSRDTQELHQQKTVPINNPPGHLWLQRLISDIYISQLSQGQWMIESFKVTCVSPQKTKSNTKETSMFHKNCFDWLTTF